MALKNLTSLIAVSGAAAAAALLFWTSQSVQRAEDRLAALQRDAAQATQSIRVLEAEWHYLNRPDRLEEMARTHLAPAGAASYGLSPLPGEGAGADIGADADAVAMPAAESDLYHEISTVENDDGESDDGGRAPPLPMPKPMINAATGDDALYRSDGFAGLLKKLRGAEGGE